MRYYLFKKVAKVHPLTAFFCEYVFYATQTLLERPSYVLASYPKCGRTWLHYMLVTYYATKYGQPARPRILSMSRREPRVPSILLTHDGKVSAFWSRNKWVYSGTRVLFVTRDPRDAVVSHFYHCHKRDNVYSGTIGEFVRHRQYGLEAVIEYMNAWWEARHQPKAFQLCRYEDLSLRTREELLAVLSFLGETDIDTEALSETLKSGSFQNMRHEEASGRTKVVGLAQGGDNGGARKVRKGIIGGYKDELIPHDVAFADALVATRLNPAFGYR